MNISCLVGKEGRELQGVISALVQTLGKLQTLQPVYRGGLVHSKHCHSAKQIASWCPGGVPVSSGKISCKDDISKDMASETQHPWKPVSWQKHQASQRLVWRTSWEVPRKRLCLYVPTYL